LLEALVWLDDAPAFPDIRQCLIGKEARAGQRSKLNNYQEMGKKEREKNTRTRTEKKRIKQGQGKMEKKKGRKREEELKKKRAGTLGTAGNRENFFSSFTWSRDQLCCFMA
jgi:hypothetical protein